MQPSRIAAFVGPAIAAVFLVSTRLSAQSFGGEVLSPRVISDFIYAPPAKGVIPADPGVDHPLVAVLLWRGVSGWQNDSSRARRSQAVPTGTGMSVGASSFTEHSHNVGGHELSFRYDSRKHRLEVLGQSYDATHPIAVLLDQADANGGPARVVGVVPLSDPFVLPARWSNAPGSTPAAHGVLLAKSLRQYPEIEAFLR
jgi:hypothetical protein